MNRSHIIGAVCAVLFSLLTVSANAKSTSWRPGVIGNWSTPSNWDNGEPGSGDNASMSAGGTAQITNVGEVSNSLKLSSGNIDMTGGSLSTSTEFLGNALFSQSGGTHTVTNDLVLGRFTQDSTTYQLIGGDLSAGREYIGDLGIARFNQTGGTHTVTNDLVLGHFSGSGGTYALDQGVLNVGGNITNGAGSSFLQLNGGVLSIAGNIVNGTGTSKLGINGGSLNVNGGSIDIDEFLLGYTLGSNASFQLDNGQSLSAGNEYIGLSGTGTFTQTGGTHTVASELNIGVVGVIGAYILENGNLSSSNEYIGDGIGSFTQSGGVHTITNDLVLGRISGGSGTYTLANGILDIGGNIVNGAGTSTLNIDGGTFNFTGVSIDVDSFRLGYSVNSNGSHTLSTGQSLSSVNEYIGYDGIGTFTQTGGTHRVADSLVLGESPISSGTYNLENGDLSANDQFIGSSGTGAFNQGGGTNTVTNALVVGFAGNGTYINAAGVNAISNDLYLGFESGSSGTYTLYGGILNVGGNIINGAGNSILNIDSGTLTVAGGSIDVDTFRLGSNLNSNGSHSLSTGQSLTADTESIGYSGTGTFTQDGGTHAATNLTIAENPGSNGTYNLNGGRLDATNIVVNSGGRFNFDGGTMLVDNFTGDLINNGGTLESGASSGITNIFGDYTQSISGAFTAGIAGLAQVSEYDLLNVTGTATLNGILDVNLLNTSLFTPSLGDTFDILMADTISGEFDILSLAMLGGGLDWDVSYILDDISMDIVRLSVVQAVPIPAAVWLFGSGLLGLIGVAKLKKAGALDSPPRRL